MTASGLHSLGKAVAIYDHSASPRTKLTPGCIGNLSILPSRAQTILRHVWKRMLSINECRELLGTIDFTWTARDHEFSGSFWLGYHATLGRLAKETGNA